MCAVVKGKACGDAWDTLLEAVRLYGNGLGSYIDVVESLCALMDEVDAWHNGPRGEVVVWNGQAASLPPIVAKLFQTLWARLVIEMNEKVKVSEVRGEVWPRGEDGASGCPVALTRLNAVLTTLGAPWTFANPDGLGGDIVRKDVSHCTEQPRIIRITGGASPKPGKSTK